jgi:hypothetical protein
MSGFKKDFYWVGRYRGDEGHGELIGIIRGILFGLYIRSEC